VGKVVSWVVKDQPDLKAGTDVVKDTVVRLTLSKGPAPRTRPTLKDMTWEQAQAALTAVQLVAERQPDEYSDTVDVGLVVHAEPTAGEKVPRGSTVKVTMSLGPQLFDVPNVVGMTFEDAKAAIVATGTLVPGTVNGPSTGKVVGSSPGAGEKVRKGTKIDIVLG
jgi:serine/threonine-protein kinase